MNTPLWMPDQLFINAERLASDFSLFPQFENPSIPHNLSGLLSDSEITDRLAELRRLPVDEYVRRTVAPSEDPTRQNARVILRRLPWLILRELEDGPLWAAEARVTLDDGSRRRIGLLAQDRSRNNGVWLPEHHLRAVEVIRELATHNVPIVTFIDTPGAAANEAANRNNQAHSISRLIAEMAQIHVPTVGIILGNGYSGGAIPLATTNLLLSVPDGVFNTIQPRGLANIARKYNLSWQECAQAVGVSPYELHAQGYLDGIIDFSVDDFETDLPNLEQAILSSIFAVEDLAVHFLATNDSVMRHYERTVRRFVNPPPRPRGRNRSLSTIDNPTNQPNVFGVAYRYLRYLGLRKRLHSTTVDSFGRLSTTEVPSGDLDARVRAEHLHAFHRWLENPLLVRYDAELQTAWRNLNDARGALPYERGRVAKFFLGTRAQTFGRALSNLVFELVFHLFNVWKSAAASNFPQLIGYVERADTSEGAPDDASVLDIASDPDVTAAFVDECRLLLIFDSLYDQLIHELKSVAREAMETNEISRESVSRLLEAALAPATRAAVGSGLWPENTTELEVRSELLAFVRRFVRHRRRGELLKSVAEWKKAAFPTVSEPLFALITFYFDHLLPSLEDSEDQPARYDGRIRPRNIGMKDFWHRLDRAYKDLLIQEELIRVKRQSKLRPADILDKFFEDVTQHDPNMMTSDPASFPGFRVSIEEALAREIAPCGTVAAIGTLRASSGPARRVGVLVSNLAFQAGSFDMASGEKFCRLLVRCAQQRLPVVCFISSGGMQTKEGAGALFSMAIVNDRITRFVRDNDLPIIMFGFGDCTGGAQASMVTHPLVDTFYFSGTSMPFAGQIVVPSHLPMNAILSNYLSQVDGAMTGLVKHPFAPDLDDNLALIDPDIPLPEETVAAAIAKVLDRKVATSDEEDGESDDEPLRSLEGSMEKVLEKKYAPVRRCLIHARGCTATKLVRGAQKREVSVVLVQSDPDMDSVAARSLGANDSLVCLGGSTPDESYLNALSIIRIAERERADSVHPGIGFLSENSNFADLCARHGFNFIGPSVSSMEWMGNKSNAVQTAQRLGIRVVPGSHGVVTYPAAAQGIAAEIGYPVIIKAVHGGGGRGIQIVEDPAVFDSTFLRMGAEAQSAFGSRDLYIEKYVRRFRHVEVQVLRDSHGNSRVLGLRDCSVQRNHQKIIEESGSTLLPEKLRREAFAAAARLADEVGYVGAGTVEFIFDLDADELYFMEMNTRLQVEHPVTEAVTGIDIVGQQFEIAEGGSIAAMEVVEQGFAIEVRINAERVAFDNAGEPRFVPDPGTVSSVRMPHADDVEVISAIDDGSVVSPFYDNLVAQLIVRGTNRVHVLDRLLEVLSGVEIRGIGTNIALLRRVLADEEFRRGEHDTGYLRRLLARTDINQLAAEIEADAGGRRGTIDRSMLVIEGSDELKVLAISQGIFYSAPAPGRSDFVAVGDVIARDQALCLLEAMKLFSEVSLETFNRDSELYPANSLYEIVLINAVNGQLVSEGDLLFVVRPVPLAA